jgi:NAD(P)-dependent dehydrogenase (short-subunit alcohol dehydrogenase family)
MDKARITPQVDFTQALRGQFDLTGQVAFVAGATGGLGEAICWSLALAGATPVVGGRDAGKCEALAGALKARGLAASHAVFEAGDVGSIRRAVDVAAKQHGRLDALVNTVGIQREQKIADVTEETFDEMLRVNVKSAMFLSQACAPHQAATGGGAQVHLLSVRAQLGLRGRGYSAYCATKGALVMLIRQHASELAPQGIRVNGVAPTVVATEMARHWLENETTRRQITDRIPLGRVAEPVDVCGTVLFFCAPAARFVTGQILYVDGGITASQ